MESQTNVALTPASDMKYTEALLYALLFYVFLLFNAPCQFTPLLVLRSLIFGLKPFGWFICIYLGLLFCYAYKCQHDKPSRGTEKLTRR
jgi:hypothetical protein